MVRLICMKQLENKSRAVKLNTKWIPNVHSSRNTPILIIGPCYIRFFILVVIRIIMIHYNENSSSQDSFACIISFDSNYLGTKSQRITYAILCNTNRFHGAYSLLNSVAVEPDCYSNICTSFRRRYNFSAPQ